MRGSVPNYFTNSLEFLKKFGDTMIDAYKKSDIPDKFTKVAKEAVKQAKGFGSEVAENLDTGVGFSKFGTTQFGTRGNIKEDILGFFKNLKTKPSRAVSDFLGSTIASDKLRQEAWFYTNPFRMVSKAAVKATEKIGLESPTARAAVAAGIPIFIHTMTETSGPIYQGLRPKGYKAVAPVSKEEDPTGATPRNIGEEFALRFVGGQKSQPLAYKDFIKERPDVMPSTIKDYRRYMNRKPEAGKRIDIDPEKQTFTAFGGLVKGTARGLNDPEIRVKGIPVSASSVLGAAAGYGTILAGKRFLDPKGLGIEREVSRPASDIKPDISGGVGMKTHAEVKERFDRAGRPMPQGPLQNIPENRREQGVPKDVGKTIYIGTSGRREQDRFGTPSFFGPRKAGENVTPRVPTAKIGRRIQDLKGIKKEYEREAAEAARKGEQLNIPGLGDSRTTSQFKTDAARAVQQEIDETVKQARNYGKPLLDKDGNPIPGTAKLNIAGQKFQEFFAERPGLKEPAIIAGGLLAAAGTAAVAKKLFKKAEQERIKKEDPLQYKKYKRGDYTE